MSRECQGQLLLFMLALAAAVTSVESLDHTGPVTIRESPTGSVDIFKADGSRSGYGVRRPDGSTDLFRPDGSRLGYIQPSQPGQPDRLILTPRRQR